MFKFYKTSEINKLKAENLKLKTERLMMSDVLEEYDKTKGNAYTYIRKVSNILKYGKA